MSQQLQELIDKIKNEGITEAQKKSKETDAQAKKKADDIVAKAKQEAGQLIQQAQAESQKIQESTRMALKQAGRDMLLSLRKEIEAALQKIIQQEISNSLTSDHLTEILSGVIEQFLKKESDHAAIKVMLNGEDLEKVKGGVWAKLKYSVKKGIEFQASETIGKGFTISFDGGKSHFDFTDTSLAEYLNEFLNPEIGALLKEAASLR